MKTIIRLIASVGTLGFCAAIWEPVHAISEFNNKQEAWSIGQIGFAAIFVAAALGFLYVIWGTD